MPLNSSEKSAHTVEKSRDSKGTSNPGTPPATFEGRLLAEATRIYESDTDPIDDPDAEAAARRAEGNFEHRLIVRAHHLTVAGPLETALQQLRSASRLIAIAAFVIAAITGATTARMVLGGNGQQSINFFWVLSSILGVQTLALLAWLALVLIRPQKLNSSSLGGIVLATGRRVTRRLHRGPLYAAAIQATALVLARSTIGRWTLSGISHGMWLAFLVGCMTLLILILSTKQYTFVWETTILSDTTYAKITEQMSLAPSALGFNTPSKQQIIDSHWTGEGWPPPGEAREAWSGLLIGSMLVYGVLPRLLLLLLCLTLAKRARSRFRLDTTLPGYGQLQALLAPAASNIGVVDPDDRQDGQGSDSLVSSPTMPIAVRDTGPTAIMGLEIAPPKSTWPPPLSNIEWLDLGFVDDRPARQRAVATLQAAQPRPRLIMVVCSLAASPDRGIRDFVKTLQEKTKTAVALVLTEGQRFRDHLHDQSQDRRRREEDVDQRSADWHQLASQARVGAERTIEIDLDHPTEHSLARLALLIESRHRQPTGKQAKIEQALALILTHAGTWHDAPETYHGEALDKEVAELHRAISELYRHESKHWQGLLRAPTRLANASDGHWHSRSEQLEALTERLKISGESMIMLLPPRLRRNPRWLAAGAVAGAMGCIAAASLGTPAVISTLPWWAGLGAAISALAPVSDARQETRPSCAEPTDFSDAVRGATLFAILLELQGCDEVIITRIIDQVAGDEDGPLESIAETRSWLQGARTRFEQALDEQALSA